LKLGRGVSRHVSRRRGSKVSRETALRGGFWNYLQLELGAQYSNNQ